MKISTSYIYTYIYYIYIYIYNIYKDYTYYLVYLYIIQYYDKFITLIFVSVHT